MKLNYFIFLLDLDVIQIYNSILLIHILNSFLELGLDLLKINDLFSSTNILDFLDLFIYLFRFKYLL